LARTQLGGGFAAGDWWRYTNGGMPFVYTYPPGLPKVTAWLSGWTGAHHAEVFHTLGALGLMLGPVAVFGLGWFCWRKVGAALVSALLYSLVSPAALVFGMFRADAGPMWGVRRLQTLLVYGETPHVAALALVPLGWLCFGAVLRGGSMTWAVGLVLVAVGVALTNSYGLIALVVGCALWLPWGSWRGRFVAGGCAVVAYALVAGWWPWELVRTVVENTRAMTSGHGAEWAVLAVVMVGVFVAGRKLDAALRWSLLLAVFFTGVVGLAVVRQENLLFHAYRYQHEFDLAWALVVGYVLTRLRVPGVLLAVVGLGLLAWNTKASWEAVREGKPEEAVVWQVARVFEEQFPGHRVMASGSAAFWLNEFTEMEQLSGGHDPMAINRAQQVAVYTIYTGQNAGARDAEVSELWLRAFNVGAIYVPGERTVDPWRPCVNPLKFAGRLPVVWERGDERIYAVPGVKPGLAQAIPEGSVVTKAPAHGLDTGQVERYVVALGTGQLTWAWVGRNKARVKGALARGQVVSVQINYHPGWRARANGQPVAVERDGLGLVLLRPRCGECEIELEFAN
ncbi:MAG: hypothetical protein JNN08_22765, partial [Bryobacterales bacterium]|nr:hypothetical protein [Bryobacterales bacterium]